MDERPERDESLEEDKKAYEPPRIVYRETLEFLAIACVPAPPSKGDPIGCATGPLRS